MDQTINVVQIWVVKKKKNGCFENNSREKENKKQKHEENLFKEGVLISKTKEKKKKRYRGPVTEEVMYLP